MTAVVAWFEAIVSSIPLPMLEVWGRFAFVVGLFLAICAFGGFTFRIGEHWGFGRARQRWDTKAFLSMPLTFVLIIATGYIGSFIVLVPGAQTLESLKDLAVLLSVVLLGYPALITIPFAYGLSDLIEGVPPEFLLRATRIFRIAIAHASSPIADIRIDGDNPLVNVFFEELLKLGYVEGRNLEIVRFSANGRTDHFREIADEIVQSRPEIIVADTSPLVRTLKETASTIPIVGITADPIAYGLTWSFAPGWQRNRR